MEYGGTREVQTCSERGEETGIKREKKKQKMKRRKREMELCE